MSAPQGQFPQDPYSENANKAWKAKWGDHLAWSTTIAVVIHAAVIAFWPAWENEGWVDPEEELLGTAWISLFAPPSTIANGGGGAAIPPLALIAEPDSLPLEVAVDANVVESDLALVRFSRGTDELRRRLAGRGGPFPSIVEPGPAAAPPGIGDDLADTREEEEAEEEVTVAVIEDPTTEGEELPLETSTLDLSRLAAVRPQIVLPGTSAWILIRNPVEVHRFMAGTFDSETEGLVDVAVWIDEWGSVEWAEISKSSGLQEMDEIALALFNEVASFRPARDRGVRVSMSAIFSVPFPW